MLQSSSVLQVIQSRVGWVLFERRHQDVIYVKLKKKGETALSSSVEGGRKMKAGCEYGSAQVSLPPRWQSPHHTLTSLALRVD